MNHLNDLGFTLKSGWFLDSTIDNISLEVNNYIKNSNFKDYTPFKQEVNKDLLEKNKHQVRELYIENSHKEAFFIKSENTFKLVNLMDPHNYISSIEDIIKNQYLKIFLDSLNRSYKFKNSILFFKNKKDNNIIDWHRDSGLDETKKLIFGVYLDESIEGLDAVKYIPGSHIKKDVTIKDVDAVEVPAKRGDVVIHYGSVFHMSPDYNLEKSRRTLYLKYNLI